MRLNNRHISAISLVILLIIAGLVIVKSHNLKSNTSNSQLATTTQSTNANFEDTSNPTSSSQSSSPVTAQTLQEDPNSQCKVVNTNLPDPTCTPGVIDPNVTQADINQTICVSGYTKTIRPPESVTSKEKKVSMAQYGFTDSSSQYEYDHLISLELGGAPNDTKNLWPEPGASPNPKDKVEDTFHSLVCSGKESLADAQQRIATNWTTAIAGL